MHLCTQLTRFRFFRKSWHACGAATTLLPYMAPSDFLLFPKLEMALKGKKFDDIGTIKEKYDEAPE
jgi:hypothetical protein